VSTVSFTLITVVSEKSRLVRNKCCW